MRWSVLILCTLLSSPYCLYSLQDSSKTVQSIELGSPIQIELGGEILASGGEYKPFWMDLSFYSILITLFGILLSYIGLRTQIRKSTANLQRQIRASLSTAAINEIREMTAALLKAVRLASDLSNGQIESGKQEVRFAVLQLMKSIPASNQYRSSLEERLNLLSENLYGSTDNVDQELKEVLRLTSAIMEDIEQQALNGKLSER